MSNQSPLIQYTKKGPPYVKTGGTHHDDVSRDAANSDAFSIASERCSVRGCTNTFATQPPKIFVPFPTLPAKRSRWLKVIGLDPAHPPSHKLFCCEDHFDLKRDVMHLSTLRSVNSGIVRNLLKDSVIPHRHTNSNEPGSSAAGEECAVKEEPNPDPEEVPKQSPRIRVRSTYELMISSTTSLSACPQPPEVDTLRRTSVIHEPPTSPPVVIPTSVIRTNPQPPKPTTSPIPQVNDEKARMIDGNQKYRECAVRGCPHNLRTFPNIQLVCVPIQDSVRKVWYKAIGRPFTKQSVHENIYVCSTHFRDDELETVNPQFWKTGSLGLHQFHNRVKHGVLPTLNLTYSADKEVWTNQPPRVPDLTPHSPSALMAGASNSKAPVAKPDEPKSQMLDGILSQNAVSQNSHQQMLDKSPAVSVSSKPMIPVQPRYQKYDTKTMPQYPECKHKAEEYQCSSLSVVDYSSFYSQFYKLDTRDEQNEFIYSHTEIVSSSSPELEQPVFKFFVDQTRSHAMTKRVQVCAQAFSICLCLEITSLISLVTRHFDTLQLGCSSQPSLVLKPVKMEEGGEDVDLMVYESVPQTVEIEDSPDEEKPVVLIKNDENAENDVNRPLTVEEELRQTVRNVVKRYRATGVQGHSKDMDYELPIGNEPSTFETVHICRRCLGQFKSKAAFKEHESEVDFCNQFLGEFFKCTTCGRTLTTFEDLKVHTTVFHKYVCPKCSDTFRYRRYLEDHVIKCTGENRLSEDMERLIERTKVIQHKIADTRKREWMEIGESGTSVTPGAGCLVVLEKLKILASDDKRTYNMNEWSDIVKSQPEEIPRLKIKAASNDAADSPVLSEKKNDSSSSVDGAGGSQRSSSPVKTEPEEEVDVESTICAPESDDQYKDPTIVKKRSRRIMSSSSEEEVIRKHPRRGGTSKTAAENQNLPPRRELRARRPISFAEPDGESDSEEIPELAGGSGGESDVDPDFDPTVEETRKSRKRRRKVSSESENTSASETESPKVSTYKSTGVHVNCGQCNASFANVSGLRAHHRLSEKCGKFPPGTIFKCDNCSKMFISPAMLDEHRATNKQCQRSPRTPTPVDNQSRASSTTSERRPHNLATGPHVCKCCKVLFNSALGLGLHLKRSQKCIADNPDVDIPGVVDKNSVVDNSSRLAKKNPAQTQEVKKPNQEVVFVCVKCHSSFSSVWGLRTHERNSTDCKPDRPYEIPVPIPKEQAEKQKKEYLAKLQKEGKLVPSSSPASPASSSGQGSEQRTQRPGFMMVYTQESQDEDGKFKCKNCSALFTSVWGLRTHQRISETCMDKNKIILSEAAAKSISKGENICPNCSAKFSTAWGLRTHLRTSSICSESETNIKAPNSKKAKEDVSVAKNGRVQPGAGCFLCPQCPKTFKLPYSLEQHFVEHAPQKEDWLCHLCAKDFADQFTMHRHFHREHLGSWFCIKCDKKTVITSFKEFYSHIFEHHVSNTENAKKYFRCSTCFKSFVSKFSYDFHVNSCKKLAEQVFHCASCQKVFNKKIHITNHMKYAHTGVVIDKRYKFKCPKCPRKFLSEKDYKQKHGKETCVQEEMPCEICGEMYSGFEKLKMHLELAHKKRSELSGKKSPDPGRGSPHPDKKTLEPVRKTPEPGSAGSVHLQGQAVSIDIVSSSSSPVPSPASVEIQESPDSPDSVAVFSVPSVKVEPSSP